ncbi:TPA: hypothetical protein ACX6QF_003754, partial [Photobacterium damselae]
FKSSAYCWAFFLSVVSACYLIFHPLLYLYLLLSFFYSKLNSYQYILLFFGAVFTHVFTITQSDTKSVDKFCNNNLEGLGLICCGYFVGSSRKLMYGEDSNLTYCY